MDYILTAAFVIVMSVLFSFLLISIALGGWGYRNGDSNIEININSAKPNATTDGETTAALIAFMLALKQGKVERNDLPTPPPGYAMEIVETATGERQIRCVPVETARQLNNRPPIQVLAETKPVKGYLTSMLEEED